MSIRQFSCCRARIGIEVAHAVINIKIMSNTTIDIEKQLSKLGKDIQQFVEKVVPGIGEVGHFQPPCDITESDKSFSVYMDLPGLTKKMIRISLKNRVLSISGDRELYVKDDDRILKRSERKQGSFSRSFVIPDDADAKSISATFKDGVLHVTLNKTESEKESDSETIPIK